MGSCFDVLSSSSSCDEQLIELSFLYNWNVQIFQQVNGFNVFGDTETFCTNFRCGSHEWMAHLYRTNFGTHASPRINLYLEHTKVMASHVSPKKCKFSFRLLATNDSFEGEPISSISAIRSSTTFSTMDSFRIPRDSAFANSLTKCFTDHSNHGKTVMITIELLFDLAAFEPNLNNWFTTVPKPPLDTTNDFRFKMLRDDLADFTLHCRDGDVKTSKSVLFLSSDYFRFLFTANDQGLNSNEHSLNDFDKSSVEQVLVFIATGTFEIPSSLSTKSAQELIDIVTLLKPLNKDAFKNTIHKALCEVAAKNFSNLSQIVEFLAFAHETNLTQLKQMCISIIVAEHYQRFKQIYNEDADDSINRLLFERIRRSGFLMTISPAARIDSIWRQSSKCKTIYRYGVKCPSRLSLNDSTATSSAQSNTPNAIWNEVD